MNLDKLFRDNYNALCVYALHYVDDIDIAEDIVMEQFVKLAEKNDSTHTIMHPDRYRLSKGKRIFYVRHGDSRCDRR